MKGISITVILTTAALITIAYQTSTEYLGQIPPGAEFVRFAQGIVTDEMIHSVTVSPDGQEIYWATRDEILMTKLLDGRWTNPVIASFNGVSDIDFYDDAPVVSPDNTKLFFNSQRPFGDNNHPRWSFWYCDRTEAGWSEPHPMPDVINSTGGMHFQVSISNNGTFYFGVLSGYRMEIHYSRLVDGAYQAPEALDVANNFGDVLAPFISPDESYIIFNKIENHMPVGYYISFKGQDNQWLPPQRLDQFPGEESCFVTRDGKYVFCKSLWASAQIIEDLRPSTGIANNLICPENTLQLEAVFPNPAQEFIHVTYNLISPGDVTGSLVDINGRIVRLMTEPDQLPGRHQMQFDANDIDSGIYFISMMYENQLSSSSRISKVKSTI